MAQEPIDANDLARMIPNPTEFQQAAAELEMRVPVAVEQSASETNRYLDLTLRERSSRGNIENSKNTEKWKGIFTGIATQAEAASPGISATLEELTFAIANRFRYPDADITDLVNQSTDLLEAVARSEKLNPIVEIVPSNTDADLENRKLLFRMALDHQGLAQNLNYLLTEGQENQRQVIRDMEPAKVETPEHIKQSGISVGQRAIWGMMAGYREIANLSSQYPQGERAQALHTVATDYDKRIN